MSTPGGHDLTVANVETAHGTVVAVGGDLDMGTVPALEAHVRAMRPFREPLRLDLADVTFFDSSAVRALLEMGRASVDDQGQQVVLVDASKIVRKVLEVAGLHDAFGFRADDDGAAG